MSNEMKLPTAYNVTNETIEAAEKALASLGFPNQEPIKRAVELMVATAGLLAEHARTTGIAAGAADMARDIVHEMARVEKEAWEEFRDKLDLVSLLNYPANPKTRH